MFQVIFIYSFIFLNPFIHFLEPLYSDLGVTWVSWSLSQPASGEGRVTPWMSRQEAGEPHANSTQKVQGPGIKSMTFLL